MFYNIGEALEPVFEEHSNKLNLAFQIWMGHLLGTIY